MEFSLQRGGAIQDVLRWVTDNQYDLTKDYSFNKLQVAVALLDCQSVSQAEIARLLKRSPSYVNAALAKFRSTSPLMRQTIEALSKKHWFERQLDRSKLSELWQRNYDERRQGGLWPQWVRPPTGYNYNPATGKLEINQVMGPKIKLCFERVARGEVPYKVALEAGLWHDPRSFYRALKDPTYRGFTVYQPNAYARRTHGPLLNESTWLKIQEKRTGEIPRVPYPYDRDGRGRKLNPDKVMKVQEMFNLRVQRKGALEIARIVGLTRTTVQRILKDHIHVEQGIVDVSTWEKAQVPLSHREVRRRLQSQNERRLLEYLFPDRRQGTSAIAKALGLSEGVLRIQNRLKARGLLERSIGRRGKWYLTQEGKEFVAARRRESLPKLLRPA